MRSGYYLLWTFSYKGYDRAKIELSTDKTTVSYDEVAQHEDARCVTAPEAMWRLQRRKLQAKSHSVSCLEVNLPGQCVRKHNQLTAYFELNKTDASARSLYYAQVREY